MAWVVFLRGVNVGGHRTFRPSELAAALARLEVVNIGAAGTFVVRARVSEPTLRAELARRLPFQTQVMICRGREVVELAAGDPFAGEPSRPDLVRFVSVLPRRPRLPPKVPPLLPAEGRWGLRILGFQGRFLLGLYRREMKAIGWLGKLDQLVGMPVTTRNWNTIGAIARALQRSKVRRPRAPPRVGGSRARSSPTRFRGS